MVPPDRRVNSILLTIFNRIKSLVYAHLQNVIRATSLYITSSHPRGHSQRPRRHRLWYDVRRSVGRSRRRFVRRRSVRHPRSLGGRAERHVRGRSDGARRLKGHARGRGAQPPTQWEPAARVDARRPAAARQVRGSQLHAREDADDPDEHAPENYAADN